MPPTGQSAAARDAEPPDGSLRHAICFFSALPVILLLFTILKCFALHPYPGDEHTYIFQAKLVTEGFAPYRDFAAAHPPVHTLLLSLILGLFGYDFTLFRVLPWAMSAVGAVLLACTVRRELGGFAAICAAWLSLLSYEPLRASSHLTGVNLTVLWLVAALWAARRGRPIACGLLSAAAILTRSYAVPVVLVLLAWTLLTRRRDGVRLVAALGSSVAAGVVALGLWSGLGASYENLVTFHSGKTAMSVAALSDLRHTLLYYNLPIAVTFVVGLCALAVPPCRRMLTRSSPGAPVRPWTSGPEGLLALSALAAAGHLAAALSLDRTFSYYFVPAFPFAAVIAGWLVGGWIRAVARLAGSLFRGARGRRPSLALLIAPLVLVVAGWLQAGTIEKKLSYYGSAMAAPPEQRFQQYEWRPSVLPGVIDDTVKRTFWRDRRWVGSRYATFTYVLWHESRTFDEAFEMAREIRENTRSTDAIFGDSGSVPLLALLSERRIAAAEVDTNIQRYRGRAGAGERLAKSIDRPDTRVILLRRRFGVSAVDELQELIEREYRLRRTWSTRTGPVYDLYERRSRAG